MLETELSHLVTQFSLQIVALVESVSQTRIQEAVANVAGLFPRRGPGRPRKNGLLEGSLALAPTLRKKAPKQLCPVPGCKNPAAPVFGMVCKDHKGVPKAKIKEYRAARKAAKVAGKGKARSAAKAKPARPKRKAKGSVRAKAKTTRRKPTAKPAAQSAAATETKSE
jgi:hypothetical protein